MDGMEVLGLINEHACAVVERGRRPESVELGTEAFAALVKYLHVLARWESAGAIQALTINTEAGPVRVRTSPRLYEAIVFVDNIGGRWPSA